MAMTRIDTRFSKLITNSLAATYLNSGGIKTRSNSANQIPRMNVINRAFNMDITFKSSSKVECGFRSNVNAFKFGRCIFNNHRLDTFTNIVILPVKGLCQRCIANIYFKNSSSSPTGTVFCWAVVISRSITVSALTSSSPIITV